MTALPNSVQRLRFWDSKGKSTGTRQHQFSLSDGRSPVRLPVRRKQGNQPISSDFFNFSAGMPLPIDYETDDLNGQIIYQARQGLISLGYHRSEFNNRNLALTWQNAFTAFNGESVGRKGLAPDNEASGWNLGAKLRISNTVLTAIHRNTEMTQNERFLPYTINGNLNAGALPAPSLNGNVNSTLTILTLNSQLTRRLSVDIRHRAHERDNDTPILTLEPVLGDVVTLAPKDSRAFSFDHQQQQIILSYRLSGTRFSAGLTNNDRKRTRSEIADNDETKRWLKVTTNTFKGLRVGLQYEDSERDAGPFQPITNNNPLTVRYHMAARDQSRWRANLDYEVPHSHLTVSVNAERRSNDYPSSTLGLQSNDDRHWGIDASYRPSERFSITGFHQNQTLDSVTFGSNAFASQDWTYSTADEVKTSGFTIHSKGHFSERLDLSMDYLYSDGAGQYATEFQNQLSGFPELISEHRSLDLKAAIRVNPKTAIELRYYREAYDSSDWALDDVRPDTIRNILNLGLVSPNYTIGLASVSVILEL